MNCPGCQRNMIPTGYIGIVWCYHCWLSFSPGENCWYYMNRVNWEQTKLSVAELHRFLALKALW